jgi:pyruvate kinase
MNNRTIKRLEALNVTLFRINLSHTSVSEVANTIRFIQKRSSVPICLDTEGA